MARVPLFRARRGLEHTPGVLRRGTREDEGQGQGEVCRRAGGAPTAMSRRGGREWTVSCQTFAQDAVSRWGSPAGGSISSRRLRPREGASRSCPERLARPAVSRWGRSAMSGRRALALCTHARWRADAMLKRRVSAQTSRLQDQVGWAGVGPRREDGVLENQIGESEQRNERSHLRIVRLHDAYVRH
jgi:hypothetical protein